MSWSWAFLAVTLVGACFTFNAYWPSLRRGRLSVPSFFAGWLTGELAAHHFAWQLAATVFFVAMGALDAWPGRLGLAITVASWAALLALLVLAERSRGIVERALADGLGEAWAQDLAPELAERLAQRVPRRHLLLPVRLRDRGVRRIANLAYASEAGRRQQLDVYVPRAGAQAAPVLLQVHGGAWVVGDKRQQALPLVLHLAARGWVCMAANYRLSPRATFPDHLVDLKRALAWTRAHAAEYGGDPDFIAVTGGSAGGHLAALLALSAGDPEYQPGFEDADTRVQACVPFYGVYDFTNRHGHDHGRTFQRFLERWVMKQPYPARRDAYERASPLLRVHADAPPFLIVHGTHDSLVPVDEARDFAAALRAVSREPVAYLELPYAQHAFEIFHSLRARRVVQGVERFLVWAWSRHRAQRAPAPAPVLGSDAA